MGIDDLIRQMREDELSDRAQEATKLSPIEYARLRKIAPQRVYQKIRAGKLTKEECVCGRSVIDVADADVAFSIKVEIVGPYNMNVEDQVLQVAEQDPECDHYDIECERDEEGNCTTRCRCNDCVDPWEVEDDE